MMNRQQAKCEVFSGGFLVMVPAIFLRIFSLIALLIIAGCTGDDHKDLNKYMQEVHMRPAKAIEPAPSFEEYRTFSYGAAGGRSPFDPPAELVLQGFEGMMGKQTDVRPDLNRPREYLENFSIGVINMVGTIKKSGELWALVSDGTGNVHRVRSGNYLGRNHGRIVDIDNVKISLIEIIPDGGTGYLERPKILKLAEGGVK